jgi:Mrp family chromosome partitioning ATPase
MLLLVARMGTTKVDAAERSIELLNRLDVAIAGVVLVGTASASNDYYYYYQPGRVPNSAPGAGKAPAPRPATNGNGEVRAAPEVFTPEPEQPSAASD